METTITTVHHTELDGEGRPMETTITTVHHTELDGEAYGNYNNHCTPHRARWGDLWKLQ
jgi:hypothetical protein